MINITVFLKDEWSNSNNADQTNPLTVNSCGYEKFITQDMEITREKGREDYNIIYLVNGKGCFKFGSDIIEVPKGNIIVYTPGQPQQYTYSHRDFTETYWAHFTGYAVESYLVGCGLIGNNIHYVDVNDDCIELFKKLIREMQFKESMYEYYISAVLLELISLFKRKKDEVANNGNLVIDDAIRKTIEFMHIKYNEKLPVEYFAKYCNLSLFRFIHKFKALTGLTPLEYIRQIRMDKSKYLLLNTSLTVSEISEIVGYDDPLYFSRVFKKFTGISPMVYKKQGGM